MLVHDVDDAPVGEITNDQLSDGRKRLLVIERGGQHGSRFGQKLLLLFDALAFRDVSQRHGEDGLVADLQLRDRGLRWEFFAVLAQTSDCGEALSHAACGHIAGRKPLDVLTMSSAKPLGNEIVERSPDRLGLRVTKDLLRAIVEDGDSLLVIDGDDRIGRNRDDPGKLRL